MPNPSETRSGAVGYDAIFIEESEAEQLERVARMPVDQLDALPFGAIRLDAKGTVLAFNAHESRLTGRQRDAVVGKNFFREVAPCTNVRGFAGRFADGVARGKLHAVFPYRFDFKMRPRNVTVTLFYSSSTKSAWVFVRDEGEATGVKRSR